MDEEVPIKRRGKAVEYDFIQVFQENELIENNQAKLNERGFITSFIYKDQTYKYQYKRQPLLGVKYFYKCRPENSVCSTFAYLFETKRNEYSFFMSLTEHSHETINNFVIKILKLLIIK